MTIDRNKAIAEAYSLFGRALNGDLHAKADVREALTTSDFPVLLSQGINRKLLAAYQTITPVWSAYSTRAVVPNFKEQKLVQVLGKQLGLSRVPEATEYPASGLSEGEYGFTVEKYGDRIPLSWETLVNDELGAFRNLDQRLATEARNTESVATAAALLNAARSDVNTAFFVAKNGNAPQNVPLTRDNLQQVLQDLGQKKDENGNVIVRPSLVLVVPPTLEFQAKAVLGAQTIKITNGTEQIEMQNPVANALQLVVDPLLGMNTNAKAASTWYVLPAPNSARPALVTGFLAGYEAPDLWVKNDTGVRPGGGSISPTEGSFDDDTIQYRARHVVGASPVDPTFAFVSRGA